MVKKNRKGFTLIELIIVITIVGILALIAIPKYFSNIERARKAEAVSTMRTIREGVLAYFSINNAYPSGWPITVVVDSETVLTVAQPISPNFTYTYNSTSVTATRITGSHTYTMDIGSGNVTQS